MSQENVEVVMRIINAYNKGDLETMLEYISPEFEFQPSGRFMDTKDIYRGRKGWIDFWEMFQAAWERISIETVRVEDLGDRVLYLGTFRGRGRQSGVETTTEAAMIHTLRDRQFIRTVTYATWAEALEAVGLSE
ncbi:MAG: SnoaL-like domain [Thermoleophilaceae bacterium]|jgi:ketosteroid isomerase-like protein|nr:SnoaL-like domain [Thermoleophilaceae bacterium]